MTSPSNLTLYLLVSVGRLLELGWCFMNAASSLLMGSLGLNLIFSSPPEYLQPSVILGSVSAAGAGSAGADEGPAAAWLGPGCALRTHVGICIMSMLTGMGTSGSTFSTSSSWLSAGQSSALLY
eukprot:CAMPEP_0202876746 /NCGR_PEP_ID=MMETSP1391-20130828/29552_1 /ASSEMBLY_ACC=CAM_ASM_000867 /TAXON_ID=1034604 /ORGANISM="Chlamydomonas leiostraca, Strain SAG 11-49" /LENGTH=123 /DNA_ID=CAMNT_0049558657 /DNA_START=283 /DNA_END=654 /DNA_ORIENTATION=-